MNRRHMIKTLGFGTIAYGFTKCTTVTSPDTYQPVLTGHGRKATFQKIMSPVPVSLIKGNDCRDNIFKALKNIEDDVLASLEGKKRILIKPNFVETDVPLCATNVDAIRGILDFLKPRWKGRIVVGESTANNDGTAAGFKNYGYLPLEDEYGITLSDLNEQSFVYRYVLGPGNAPLPIRIISTFLDRDQYVISAAKLKTHDRVLTTLSLKNILLAAPYNEYNKYNDKRNMHPLRVNAKDDILHFNMFNLAQEVYPDLGVIDGFEAMEGNGPVNGTPVDACVALASLDPLALDTLATKIMGFDPTQVLYLSAMNKAGMGQGDLDKIRTIGSDIIDCQYNFKPSDRMAGPYGLG